MEYAFSREELAEIQRHVDKYPEPRSAVMPALWIAQEKFGWLSDEAIKLVAETLNLPFAHVYGVATFYTMYFKEEVPPNLIEICTCFTCGEMEGPQLLDFLKDYLQTDEKGRSQDGKIWVRAAECLGACDTAPVGQVSNRRYVHRLNNARLIDIVTRLQNGEEIPYERIPLTDQSIIQD